MLRKRLIFTLLYSDGQFMLSRNFRLQKVGDYNWLKQNYDFSRVSRFIDELIVLDITRGERDRVAFAKTLSDIAKDCFVPIAAGGGLRTNSQVEQLLEAGADKIVLNTPLFEQKNWIHELSSIYGQQCLVASLDVKPVNDTYFAYVRNGELLCDIPLSELLVHISTLPVGELYLNSIERDGTGHGYDLKILKCLPSTFNIPVILAGGAGNQMHLDEGLKHAQVDAVATAHLFNFIGDALFKSREHLLEKKHDLAIFEDFEKLN